MAANKTSAPLSQSNGAELLNQSHFSCHTLCHSVNLLCLACDSTRGCSRQKLEEPQEAIAHLEYEAAHARAGGQHEQDVGEEHEVALALLLANKKQSSAALEEFMPDVWREPHAVIRLPLEQ